MHSFSLKMTSATCFLVQIQPKEIVSLPQAFWKVSWDSVWFRDGTRGLSWANQSHDQKIVPCSTEEAGVGSTGIPKWNWEWGKGREIDQEMSLSEKGLRRGANRARRGLPPPRQAQGISTGVSHAKQRNLNWSTLECLPSIWKLEVFLS